MDVWSNVKIVPMLRFSDYLLSTISAAWSVGTNQGGEEGSRQALPN